MQVQRLVSDPQVKGKMNIAQLVASTLLWSRVKSKIGLL